MMISFGSSTFPNLAGVPGSVDDVPDSHPTDAEDIEVGESIRIR